VHLFPFNSLISMNILVTGGAGYIGSHAVRQLLEAGHSVIVLDNLSYGHRNAIPNHIPFYCVDLKETGRITAILCEHHINAVMHFAALISVGESVQKPLLYYRNNTAGAISLLEAMERAGVKRFVFSSTAATYGEPEETPIFETTKQQPINPYGRSKWFVEQILRDMAAADPKFGFAAFRYFNVAGASEDGTIGEDHQPETHLIPLVLFAAMGKRDNITVFGTDYPTSDGTCIRDYVHINDLVTAHILAIEMLSDGDARFYNLGIGYGYSVKEILDTAKKVTGREIPTVFGSRREGDPARLFANSDKVQQELGWQPQHTDIGEVIASAWHWHTTHPNGYTDSY
jgi:UDP-glucose 4-epimerase